jgi:hypothetical protein
LQPALADDGETPARREVSAETLYARAVTPRSLSSATEVAPPAVTAQRTRLISNDPLPIGADGRPAYDLAGVSYRWWSRHGRSDVGVGVGTLGHVVMPTPGLTDSTPAIIGSTPTVTVGWRYRTSQTSSVFADASGARGLGLDNNNNYINTKVGAEWKASSSRLGFDRGNLGMQFDSGYRMTVRLRKSSVGVYLRGQF